MSSTYYGAKEGSDVYKPEYDRPKKKEEDNVIRKEADSIRQTMRKTVSVKPVEEDEFVECDECGEEATAYVDANLCDECFDDKDDDGDGVIENENKNDDNDDDYVPSSSGGFGISTLLSLVVGLFVMRTVGLVFFSMMGTLTDTFESSTNAESQIMGNVTTALTNFGDFAPLMMTIIGLVILIMPIVMIIKMSGLLSSSNDFA